VSDAPLPLGTPVELDPDTVLQADGSVFGGSPGRLFRLNEPARRAFAELRDGVVRSAAGGVLGRRFTDAGVLHPVAAPPGPQWTGTVTVLVPARDRLPELDRCLAALRASDPDLVAEIVVVDDGSADPAGVRAVGRRHGARVIPRRINGGPAAARNSGLAAISTAVVACCDSDCAPPPGWIAGLIGHLDDPLVAGVAPRVVAESHGGTTLAARFSVARSPLDLGERAARVRPMTRVAYVPTAAVLLRTSAVAQIGGFDETLRYGEDVDLIWRLIEGGWRVRYEPAVAVAHGEPTQWPIMLRRRRDYGSSAALLDERHPGQVAPLVLVASPGVTVAATVAGRPLLAGAATAAGYVEIVRALRRSDQPATGVVGPLAKGVRETWFGTGRWVAQFALPLALVALWRARGRRRLALAALLAAPPLREWWQRQPDIDPLRWTVAVLVDDAAYGAGVWAGAVRARRFGVVWPQLRLRLVSGVDRVSGKP
jgi:mycofactocin system glycosyltransferase